MHKLSRYSLIGIAAAVAVLVVGVYLLAGSDEPDSSTSPSITEPSLTPTASPDSALRDGFDSAFETAVPGATSADWAPVVRYFVGGRAARVVDRNDVGDRDAWASCPDGVTRYAARRCPVSMNDTVDFAASSGDVVAEPGAPRIVGCDKVVEPPKVDGMTAVSLRPDANHRDCFSDFAVTVYVNEDRQIEAVNFVLSSP